MKKIALAPIKGCFLAFMVIAIVFCAFPGQVAAFVISGRVVDSATQTGIQGVKVFVSPSETGPQPSIGNDTTDISGNYAIQEVPDGDYRVHFSAGSGGNLFQINDNNFFSETITVAGSSVVLPDIPMYQGGKLAGRVMDAATQGGIQGIHVTIYSQTGHFSASADSDASGMYRVDGVPGGSYKVRFNGGTTLYVDQWFNNKGNLVDGDTVQVTAPDTTTLADALLVKGGAITGRVRDSITQTGIQSVQVSVYDSRTDSYVKGAATDAAGEYAISGLPGGSYKAEFRTSGALSAPAGSTTTGQTNDGASYLGKWYNDKAERGVADTVTVTGTDTTTLADTLLVKGGTVTGRVRDSVTKNGIPGISVSVCRVQYASGPVANACSMSAVTDAAGSFTAKGLASGIYTIGFDGYDSPYLRQYYDNKGQSSADKVTVTAPDTTCLADTYLVKGGVITGQIRDATTLAGIQGVQVTLHSQTGYFTASATSDASGTYRVAGLPGGSYKVLFSSWDPPYVDQWYRNKESQSDGETVQVTVPDTTTLADVLMVKGGAISGRIGDAVTQGAIQWAWVNVYDSLTGSYVKGASTDASGGYTVSGLANGDYKVYVGSVSPYLGQWYRGKTDSATADPVSVTVPATTALADTLLVKGGTITGRVRDSETKTGIPGVGVTVCRIFDATYQAIACPGFPKTYSDSSGAFAVNGLTSGTYAISFGGGNSSYEQQFYNSNGGATAENLVVTAPGTISLADAFLTKKLLAAAKLAVTVTGNGSGTVNSDPSVVACPGGSCSISLAVGSPVTLMATPSSSSFFLGWTGGGCSGNNDCMLNLAADTTVTAVFSVLSPARIFGVAFSYYQSILAAYRNAPIGSSINLQTRAADFDEPFTLDRDITVNLQGGYDGSYGEQIGYATLHGTVTIASGSLIVENLAVY